MDNTEFLSSLASRLDCSIENAFELTEMLVSSIITELDKGNNIFIQEFGSFHIIKKDEHIAKSPTSNEPILVPPKLIPKFIPDDKLKDHLQLM